MGDRVIEYINKAKADGRQIQRRYANGLDYLFIFEKDGWISIIECTGGEYKTVIQAKDLEHAETYIAMIEPLTVPVNFL